MPLLTRRKKIETSQGRAPLGTVRVFTYSAQPPAVESHGGASKFEMGTFDRLYIHGEGCAVAGLSFIQLVENPGLLDQVER